MPKENLYTEGCIRTRFGMYVNILNPDPDTLIIEDIAHALSRIQRFGGHLEAWYSVARHSLNCAINAESAGFAASYQDRFDLLMHDCVEAYLGDIPSPIKKLLPDYQKLEYNFNLVLSKKFGYEYPFTDLVKFVDRNILEREWNTMMLSPKSNQVNNSDFLQFKLNYEELNERR